MRVTLLYALLVFFAPASPAFSADKVDVSGKWGDATGRIGCFKDGEFLTFDGTGSVTIPEGDKFSYKRNGETLRINVGKQDFLTVKILSADEMDLVEFERDGSSNPGILANWKKRHGKFVRCKR